MKKNDTIREIIVLTSGDNHAMVRIKGEIKQEDIDKIINKHGNGG